MINISKSKLYPIDEILSFGANYKNLWNFLENKIIVDLSKNTIKIQTEIFYWIEENCSAKVGYKFDSNNLILFFESETDLTMFVLALQGK